MVVIATDQLQHAENTIKDARSKLLDVLANIRSGKIEEEYDYDDGDDIDQEFSSPPQKRRHTTNYVALSGIQRRTRSTEDSNAKNASKSFSVASCSTPPANTARPSTFVLKLFDRTVDLAQFSHVDANEDAPLYPVCRAWVHSQQINQDSRTSRNKLLIYPPNQDGNQEAGAVGTIYRLPKPLDKKAVLSDSEHAHEGLTETDYDQINLRIAESVRNWKRDPDVRETLDKLIDSKNGDTWSNDDRLIENCKRWKRIRDEWKAAAKLNEKRYAESAKILRDIYSANTVKHSDI